MRAFGIFSIIAALSAALSVSAAPVGPSTDITGLNGGTLDNALNIPGTVSNLVGHVKRADAPSVNAFNLGNGVDITKTTDILSSLPRDVDEKSIPAIIIDVTVKIKAVVAKIEVLLAAEVDIKVLVSLLLEIKAILVAALVSVKALVGLSIEALLCLDGKVLAIADVAVLIAALIRVVVEVIIKIHACIKIDFTVVAQVCIDIVVALAAVLAVVFGLVGGLLVVVVKIVADLVVVIKSIDVFVALVAVLKL